MVSIHKNFFTNDIINYISNLPDVIKAKEEERLACENMIASANLENQTKTIKTIIKYEKIKSNVSTYDINERSRLLQQIEDFNFAD